MNEELSKDDQVVSPTGVGGVVLGFDSDRTMVQIRWDTPTPYASWRQYPKHGLQKLTKESKPVTISSTDIDRWAEIESYARELEVSVIVAINRLVNVGLGQPGCGTRSPAGLAYVCTLEAGHPGQHEAHVDNVADTWISDASPELQQWRERVHKVLDAVPMKADEMAVDPPHESMVGWNEVDTVSGEDEK